MKMLTCVLAIVGAVACGGSPCAVAEQAAANYNSKRGECDAAAVSINGAACRDNESACNASDLEKLRNLSRCTDALPVCTSDTRTAFGASSLACLANYEGMSATCRDATSIRF